MQQKSFYSLIIFTILTLIHVVTARDLRNVTEPKIPQICISLKATGKDDSTFIQKALDSCTKGKAVALSSGIFNSGPLTIPSGVSLLVEEGVSLRALPTASLYDMGTNACGTIDEYGLGCKPFITIRNAVGSGIYGKGTIDGRGSSKMTGTNRTWWQKARDALSVHKLQNNPRLIQINNSVDITLYQITLKNPPFYCVATSETYGFTAWAVTIYSPGGSPNTDGIDPVGSQNVTIAYCNITTGDDNVGIKALTAPGRHVSVLNNHFGRGHGLSIGSETNYGVSDVTVSGLTVNNCANGVRIKTNTFRGGLITNVKYDNVCITNAEYPIHLDEDYYHIHGTATPAIKNITISNVRVLTNGTYRIHGLSKSNPIEVTLINVHIAKGSKFSISNANIKGNWIEDVTGGSCGLHGNV
uniref:Glycoside hydrolase family 28 n=1 Tax=Aretaon asperrimus TaxID=173775 RepID=A0A191XSX0_9NEOP|nr:glycoside hydrolase family 28 [Aretaon asperrimus]